MKSLISRIKKLLRDERISEIIRYLIVGGATTLVSFVVFFACEKMLGIDYRVANVISWVFAVAFAFITNRRFVFNSDGNLITQLLSFVASRLFSLGAEEGSMILMVEVLKLESLWAKIIAQVIVVILNYILGKFFVFRKKKKDAGGK